MLLGSAMLGAVASDYFSSIQVAMCSMGAQGMNAFQPTEHSADFYNRKYKIFMSMIEHQKIYRNLMQD